ncbi:hypothetical protein IFM89_018092, partial [Coptis chinensis]
NGDDCMPVPQFINNIVSCRDLFSSGNAKEMAHFCLLQMQRSKRGIEDTYLERSTKESKNDVLQHLSWLGLDWDWDEGPGIGGDYGPYRQFGRNSLYNHYAKKRLDFGNVYCCFCSNEINIDPESLKPKLPSKKDLKPYLSTCYLEYKGHKGSVMSISVQVSGQWLAYGSSDGTVHVWEVETGRCVRIWKVGEVVHYVAWNPIPELRILAASMGHDVLLLNSGLGNEEEQEHIKNFYILRLLNHLMNPGWPCHIRCELAST